jgi:hypothetical protein
MTKRQLTREQMREAARAFGREGGRKRKALLSAKRRRAIASQASKARWDRLSKDERRAIMRRVARAKAKGKKPGRSP